MYAYVCKLVCVWYVCMYLCKRVNICLCKCTYLDKHICVDICTHMCLYVHWHICIHVYICVNHTHTNIYMYINFLPGYVSKL